MAMSPLFIIRNAFILISDKLGSFLASLLSAIIIIIIGYIIGKLVWKGTLILLDKVLDLDSWLKKKKLHNSLYGIKLSALISTLTKWYVYLIFLSQAMYVFEYDILRMAGEYLYIYLPTIYMGIGILILGALLGELFKNFVKNMKIPYKDIFGEIVKMLVLYFAFYYALITLGLSASFVLEIFQYFMLSFVVGAGAALGALLIFENREKLKL